MTAIVFAPLLISRKEQEAAVERDEILKAISTLSFHNKQRDVYDKHHHGTGQWLLSAGSFQKWFKGAENTTLWCPGIRRCSTYRQRILEYPANRWVSWCWQDCHDV